MFLGQFHILGRLDPGGLKKNYKHEYHLKTAATYTELLQKIHEETADMSTPSQLHSIGSAQVANQHLATSAYYMAQYALVTHVPS